MSRIIKLVTLSAFLFASGVACGPSYATTLRAPTLREAIKVSSIVARVEITNARPMLYKRGGQNISCGSLYRARVVETFKGETGTFEFFSENDAFFSGFDRQYFVVAYEKKNKRTRTDKSERAPETTLKSCIESRHGYFVSGSHQMVVPFEVNSAPFQGEWLRPNRDYPSGSIVSDPDYEYQFLKNNSGDPCKAGIDLFNWNDVKRDILLELGSVKRGKER